MIPEDQRSVNHDPKVQPFCRNTDPQTSADAAKQRSLKITDLHVFVLRHHLEHRDTDKNAGLAAVKAGITDDSDQGRRASRTLREDYGWCQWALDRDGKPAQAKNHRTNRWAQRNCITEAGSAALMEITVKGA